MEPAAPIHIAEMSILETVAEVARFSMREYIFLSISSDVDGVSVSRKLRSFPDLLTSAPLMLVPPISIPATNYIPLTLFLI